MAKWELPPPLMPIVLVPSAVQIQEILSLQIQVLSVQNTSNMSTKTGNIGAIARNICTNTNSIIA